MSETFCKKKKQIRERTAWLDAAGPKVCPNKEKTFGEDEG
jgi:hypothetical protein